MQPNPENTTKVKNKLKFWAQELHDMSGRNRLLFYKDTKTSTAIIETPGFVSLFNLLVEQDAELFAPLPDPKEKLSILDTTPLEPDTSHQPKIAPKLKDNEIQTNHSVAVLNKVLYNLGYMSHTIQEEQGFNILYIAFGMLKWRESQNSDFSFAPLILVPVQISRESLASPYKITMAEDDIVVNPVLQTKLSKDFGIELAEVNNDITPEQLNEYLGTVSKQVQKLDEWEVQERAAIGVFNFLTLLLIKDFENHASLYEGHPIIQTLSGIDIPLQTTEKLVLANELDDLINPETVYQIMDADSSQQEAIEAAKQGLSFVLQGPPGTGKSQTIANIIAEFMMMGKKILFVSQKMAALEVVQNRLNQKGLGEFCLEVHSHKMDKRKVIDNLMRSLANLQIPPRKTDYQAQQQEIKQTRNDLNTYVRQLHLPRFELGISLYKAQGELAQLLDEPQLSFAIQSLERITLSIFSDMKKKVSEITKYSQIISTFKQNRWKGFQPLKFSIQERDDLSAHLQEAADAITDFCKIISQAATDYGLPIPESIQDCINYLDVLNDFTPDIFSPSLQSTIQNYLGKYKSFSRYFNIQYWRDSSALRTVYRKQTRPTPAEVFSVLSIVQGMTKKVNPLKLNLANDAEIPLNELKNLKKKMLIGFQQAKVLFDPNNTPSILRQEFRQPADIAVAWFLDHAENTNELAEWANFNASQQDCRAIGLGDFVAKAIDKELPPQQWEKAFLRRYYVLLVDKLAEAHPSLQKFRSTLQSEVIERFKTLDLALIENSPREIQARLYEDKPQATWIQSGSAETAILRKEYNKKRRIMPLRKLFHEIPNSIQSLKPCLMMSPLTVCQLLDPAVYQFDIVIFDEASQIPPEYAIGAFLRSKQVIVAGDRHQLPPTNFFQAIEIDEGEADEELDVNPSFESILNACDSSGFPSKMLSWHYRSRDESLIAYSNYHFYENRLFTFPNANTNNSKTGLQYIYLPNGVYKKGAGARHNLIEARKVAQLVREHLAESPELSLGIVAFSVSQRKAIEAELEMLRRENSDLNAMFSEDAAEPIFIKNLENVQGDERDVIILSIGYGKDETGKMTLNFGPINRDGGARRLNVAVTRARFALKVVTSIEPEDIDLARASSRGAQLLRNYLEVARDGFKAVFKDEKIPNNAEFDSPFEESVYSELTSRGIQLAKQVGVSQYRIDLAVVDPDQPGRFLLGIECDGAMYHSAQTARDRDRLRQQVLENLGWKIHRIWSRDWIQNRSVEIEKLRSVIELRKQQLDSERLSPKKKITEAAVIQTDESDPLPDPLLNGTMPPGAILYKPRKLPLQRLKGADELLHTPISLLTGILKVLVDAEGPISVQTAKYRVIEAWETRKGSRIDEYLNRVIDIARRQNVIAVKGDFLWPINMQTPPLRMHTPGQPVRDLEEIAPEEIGVAIKACVQSALGIFVEDLVRETLKLFGLIATSDHSALIKSQLDQMVSQDILKLENNKISKGRNFEQ